MDESGNGKLIELQDLGKANKSLIVSHFLVLFFFSFHFRARVPSQGFTQESFRQMCILSGCDYLSSIPGVGLGRASKLMKRFNCNPYKVSGALRAQDYCYLCSGGCIASTTAVLKSTWVLRASSIIKLVCHSSVCSVAQSLK